MKSIKEVLFWLIASLLLLLLFGKPYEGYLISFYFVAFLLPVIIGTSYMFNSYLVPRFLLRKRYLKFGLYTFYTIVISLNLEMLVIILAFTILANYQYDHMVPAATNIFGLAVSMYFVVLLKAFTLLIKSSFVKQEEIQLLEMKQKIIEKGYLTVRVNRKNAKVLLENILYLESLSDYVKIHTTINAPIITKEKISTLEEKLTLPFIRIHRSFIINIDKIDSFSADEVIINSKELPISRTYKRRFKDLFSSKS
jgi:two-component system, LytTR family, response regulator